MIRASTANNHKYRPRPVLADPSAKVGTAQLNSSQGFGDVLSD